MGNKSNTSKEMNKTEITLPIKEIDKKRQQEIIHFLLSNRIKDEDILKINAQKISNEIPFFSFTSKFGYNEEDYIKSHFILISNDIIIISTEYIYKERKEKK